ncbi:MAG: biotin--[acetyl-CoA-carboxylase] ligase [Eubacteriales bacterium]|nr:biotin--[acetyl-CoA-carboxylase] ligase [Eubacteriales bacterium]
MKDSVLSHLSPDYPWRDRFQFFPELDSTNDRLVQLARQGAPHGTVLLADRQTGGRGRLGRSFDSPAGMGIYMSILLRPDCGPGELMHLTCATGVAMCDALEKVTGLRPGIKWTNDLVLGKRKLAGILTQLSLTPQGQVDWAIVGVGVNCLQAPADFSPAIQATAGSLAMALGHGVDRGAVAAAMMEGFWSLSDSLLTRRPELLARYRRDCITIGQDVSLVRGPEVRHGHALDVDDQGALVVEFEDGTREAVNAGEVSVRGMYGYV